jgi:outer membrane protein assembly complex protein YaeT
LCHSLAALALAAFGDEHAVAVPSAAAGTDLAQSASGQSGAVSYQGVIVQEIRFPAISSATDQKRLSQLIPQRPGTVLDRELVRQSIQRLYATGKFADIRAEVDPIAGGVMLSFQTVPTLFVGSVTAEGAPSRPTASQIVNASKLQLGDVFSRDKMDRALTSIRQLMEANGYYKSTVSEGEQIEADKQQVTIVLRVQPGPQARVGEVNINGDAGFTPKQVRDIARMHSGDAVTVQRISNALDRLRKKYQKQNRLLAQVSVAGRSYRPEADRVDYTLEIAPGPKVEILAEGFKVSRRVLKRNVPVFEENAVDEDLLSEGRRNLLNYLQSRGYFDAKVGLRKHSDPNRGDLQLIYTIDAGARHKLVKVEIIGNKYFRTEDLRSRMQVQTTSRVFARGRYSQVLLTADIRGLENLYRNNGFQSVKISSRVLDNYGGKENDFALEITVDEGAQTIVGAFLMLGNRTFSEEQLRPEVLQTSPGQPYSEATIAQDRDNLLNYYFNHGFPQATFEATAQPIAEQPNRMTVTYAVHEGDQVFVDNVYVSGLHYTRPFVVQRDIQVKPGDPLSQIDMLDTQRRLYDLGLFSQVDTAVQNPNGSFREKNVLVNVQEAKRYTFNYGFGLEFQTGQPSSVGTNQALGQTGVSPRVSLDVTRINFRGQDHTITFKADVGGLQQRGLLSYSAPRWFNSPDWTLSFTAFYDNTLDVTTFASQRLEGSVQAEQKISKASTFDYRFTYRRVKASDIEISPALIPLLSLPARVGEPGFSYIRNKRDNDLESTKGSYTTVDAGVAASYFGSEADFSRILAQNSTYHAFGKNRPPDKKFVLARSLRIGVESAFGSTVILQPGQVCSDPAVTTCPGESIIPLPERFFSGGGNSHRGFGLNQAGPRDPITGFPLGGSALFLNNLELRFPPTPLPFFQDNISFAVFEDAGNVFTDGRQMLDNLLRWRQKNPQLCVQQSTYAQCDFSYISHAIGVGVRYKTPIGPVRFDFGYNLNPPAFPSFQTVTSGTGQQTNVFVPQHESHFNVYFSIGQSF